MGKNMRLVLGVMAELGSELGRPPTRFEIGEALPEVSKAKVTHALKALSAGGMVEEVEVSHYVQLKTFDGKAVVWKREVVDE